MNGKTLQYYAIKQRKCSNIFDFLIQKRNILVVNNSTLAASFPHSRAGGVLRLFLVYLSTNHTKLGSQLSRILLLKYNQCSNEAHKHVSRSFTRSQSPYAQQNYNLPMLSKIIISLCSAKLWEKLNFSMTLIQLVPKSGS